MYFCKGLDDELSEPHKCDFGQAAKQIDEFVNFLKEIRSKGVDVVATKIDINNINVLILTLSSKTDLEKLERDINRNKNSLLDIDYRFC